MPPRKLSGSGKRELCSSDPHYIEKRAKNNDAVKKSREKTRMKAKETMEKVSILKQVTNIFLKFSYKYVFSLFQENEMLEERIKLLHKELVFLKDIFFAHAGTKHGLTDVDMDIKNILEEDEVAEKDI